MGALIGANSTLFIKLQYICINKKALACPDSCRPCAFPRPPQKQDSVSLDMERATKEMEVLRKQHEAVSQELKEASQEAEVAKCRRDWAFQERDKMVAERESIR